MSYLSFIDSSESFERTEKFGKKSYPASEIYCSRDVSQKDNMCNVRAHYLDGYENTHNNRWF